MLTSVAYQNDQQSINYVIIFHITVPSPSNLHCGQKHIICAYYSILNIQQSSWNTEDLKNIFQMNK